MIAEKNKQGFTLIELMIVVTIIGILVSVALPSVFNYRRERVGAEAARALSDRLRGLQRMAVTSNRSVVLRLEQGASDAISSGTARGGIQVHVSRNNTCCDPTDTASCPRLVASDLNFSTEDRFRVDNAQISVVSPSPGDNGFNLELCLKPDGRVLRLSTLQPTVPDTFSEGVCDGDETNPNWNPICNRAGVVCFRVANISETCPDQCPGLDGECSKHVGIDHIIMMNFAGQTRMVQ